MAQAQGLALAVLFTCSHLTCGPCVVPSRHIFLFCSAFVFA